MKPCPGLPTIRCRGVCFACDSCACGCECADVETKKPGTHLIGVEWEDAYAAKLAHPDPQEKPALRYNAEGLLPCVFCEYPHVTLIFEKLECYAMCRQCDARGPRIVPLPAECEPPKNYPGVIRLTSSEQAKIGWNHAHHEGTVA